MGMALERSHRLVLRAGAGGGGGGAHLLLGDGEQPGDDALLEARPEDDRVVLLVHRAPPAPSAAPKGRAVQPTARANFC